MEHTVMEMLKIGAWLFGIIFLFAIIGVIATIRWIFGMIFRGERAVASGVQSIEDKFHGG